MASDLNKTIIIGRLTRDPELKQTSSGTSIVNFSMAINYGYSKDGEKKETVSFFNCVAWAITGEIIVKYCKKGHRLAIEGRLQQNRWEDADGKARSSVNIVVDTFQMLTANI